MRINNVSMVETRASDPTWVEKKLFSTILVDALIELDYACETYRAEVTIQLLGNWIDYADQESTEEESLYKEIPSDFLISAFSIKWMDLFHAPLSQRSRITEERIKDGQFTHQVKARLEKQLEHCKSAALIEEFTHALRDTPNKLLADR